MSFNYGDVLKEHVDRFCGDNPDEVFHDRVTGIKVAKFSDVPDKGLVTFLSVGLSGHFLEQGSGRHIKQEFLITVDDLYSDLPVEDVIFTLIKIVLDSHHALKQGEVIGPLGPLFEDNKYANLAAVICSYPAFFPDEFSFFECMGETTVFVELIMITKKESDYARVKGWSAFFDKIDSGEINILDLSRQ